MRKKTGLIDRSLTFSRRSAIGSNHQSEDCPSFSRTFLFRCEFRLAQFEKRSIHDNARPMATAGYFIRLKANLRILSHPLNFFSKCRKHIEAIRFVGKANRHYVGLVVQCTRKTAQGYAVQKLDTFISTD